MLCTIRNKTKKLQQSFCRNLFQRVSANFSISIMTVKLYRLLVPVRSVHIVDHDRGKTVDHHFRTSSLFIAEAENDSILTRVR